MSDWELARSYDYIEDAGHLIIEETPDELVKEILDFTQA
ncbi:hypothetical protein EHLJMEHL_04300 [Vreelandella titanicae]|mgnify:CR=1 FL=1|jgi:pimeloyl-ACP methyl ester carboxylesterase|tara:strand:- start:980 stop:1096 length:117 start_codon:yes stop_codon:yes gene_type:complete